MERGTNAHPHPHLDAAVNPGGGVWEEASGRRRRPGGGVGEEASQLNTHQGDNAFHRVQAAGRGGDDAHPRLDAAVNPRAGEEEASGRRRRGQGGGRGGRSVEGGVVWKGASDSEDLSTLLQEAEESAAATAAARVLAAAALEQGKAVAQGRGVGGG